MENTTTTIGIADQNPASSLATPQNHATNSFSLFEILLMVGVLGILGAFIYIGRKLQILDDLKETTKKVKYNLKVIADFLISNSVFNPKELESYSPLKLTELGMQKVQNSGFEKIFNEHKDKFFNFIESEEAKTKYDVEIASIKSISALFYKDFFGPLKNYFYDNPEIDENQTKITLGVYLRDEYLKEHTDID
ncbi:MAG: hypothetical protein COV79_03075 [Parcubacteria group bacterium CG11_big_fil_rev_8_21_14_0_20_41_14]|nr:MAG: hypothetical protein COV79_03075 [Parcubacteria group bacterium CG11_big_fil_rev_8_21_14_0_20_41_14]PIR57601.1 MAG: hypothetical protein COU72_00070 [Parcubacteria group bacterium CG10_big_fil_rev_8_21_14_0_10_41_35]